jgi:NADH-quinone oxidoreductase subunit F
MKYSMLKDKADREWRSLAELSQPVIHVGVGTCGLAAGAGAVLERIEETSTRLGNEGPVLQVGCLGMCYLEPLMALRLPGGPFVYYGELTPERGSAILTAALRDGEVLVEEALFTIGEEKIAGVPRFEELPMIKPQVRIATRNCGLIDPMNIDHSIARGGYAGLRKALSMTPEEVVERVKRSGLRGRGGAGFSTGTKWEFAQRAPGEVKYFVCNADEGDPGAFMDRSLLEGDPHAVLEGMAIGAYAIGASVCYIYARAEYPLAIERLRHAIEQMREYGLLGDDVLGRGFSLDIRIKEGAGAFVCGEETALMASIEGARGMPRPRPPFPAQSGIDGKPTNINNVETLSNVSAIFLHPDGWYEQYGTEGNRGTKTFSLAGNVERTGLIEVPMGIELGEIIFDIGGGIPQGKQLKAVQTGGPSGGCIPVEKLNIAVDYDSLAEVGSIMGSGGMVVMDEDTCMVDMARYFLSFTHEESCGKCLPCRIGTGRMLAILEDICSGRGRAGDIELLESLGAAIKKAALCGLGQTAPNPVLSTLRYFREEYEAHINERRCPAVSCTAMFAAPCTHACPLGTDVPAYVALVAEGRLEDAYEVLLQTNPFPAVCGRVCDHRCQLKCRRGTLDEPVAIRNLKRYVTDNGRAARLTKLSEARSERIAVVGAGPAGLTAARELALRGYRVTVFESLPEPGGMLRWGIPEYRLPKEVLAAEIGAILDLGVELRTSTCLGRDLPWARVVDEFDAVFLSVGAQRSMALHIPGEELEGVEGALEFLRHGDEGGRGCEQERVAVIGGGNSAIDAARTAVRRGAASVTILYRRLEHDMPAEQEEIEAAREEGVVIECLTAPVELNGVDGRVTGLVCQRHELGRFDRSGRRTPVPVAGETVELDVDRVIVAVGQAVELPFRGRAAAVEVSARGVVETIPGTRTMTSHAKVFAGGDAVTGPATVVRAIAAGFDAAAEIDGALRRAKGEPPSRALPVAEVAVPGLRDEEPEAAGQERMPRRTARERRGDFGEVELGYSRDQARTEARRCLRCDVQVEEASSGRHAAQ